MLITVLNRDHVNGFLQHLNNQQSIIRFTMEIEKDNTIPFLDTSVTRDSDGLLITRVYRKHTHTNQYLAYVGFTPSSVSEAWISVCTTEPSTSQRNHQLSLKKRNICHQYLFLMDTLLRSYKNSQRKEE